jgi:hypothetical protein
MGYMLRKTVACIASRKSTVAILLGGIFLLFFASLDQAEFGLEHMLNHYVESFGVIWTYGKWLPFSQYFQWIKIPLPGGYTLGLAIILNLFLQAIKNRLFEIKKLDFLLVYAGVITLIIGQGTSQILRKEHYINLNEGEVVQFVEKQNSEKSKENAFSITLDKTTQEYYPQTNIPKSVYSKITLKSSCTDISTNISINKPLRWGWYTFYQNASSEKENSSILLVVYNPVKNLPYLSATLILVGLLSQFSRKLFLHLHKREVQQ